jgi:hypothetical protein
MSPEGNSEMIEGSIASGNKAAPFDYIVPFVKGRSRDFFVSQTCQKDI